MRYCSNCNKKLNEKEECYYLETTEEYFCYEDEVNNSSCIHRNLIQSEYSESEIEEILDGKGDFEVFSTVVPD